jgi:hypothetical protein
MRWSVISSPRSIEPPVSQENCAKGSAKQIAARPFCRIGLTVKGHKGHAMRAMHARARLEVHRPGSFRGAAEWEIEGPKQEAQAIRLELQK